MGVARIKRLPRLTKRRGAATVEFAICLPVLVLIVLGSIEATSMIFLKQSLQTAAYEAARTAIARDAADANVAATANNILNARRVQGFSVTFPNGSPEAANRGQLITVRVQAPSSINSPIAGRFLRNRTISAQTVMMKE